MTKPSLLFRVPVLTIGATAAMAAAYNVITDGNAKAKVLTKDELGEDYVDMFIKNQSSSKESHLLEHVKSYVLKQRMDNTYVLGFIRAKNYLASWGKELGENILPIGLSAVILGANKFFKNQKVAKYAQGTAAVLLVLDAAKIFVHDVLGKGKSVDY